MWIEDPSGDYINSAFITRLTVDQRDDRWFIFAHLDATGCSGRIAGPFGCENVARDIMQGIVEDLVFADDFDSRVAACQYLKRCETIGHYGDIKNNGYEGTD